MSWNFSVTGTTPQHVMEKLRNEVDLNQHCPKDGRIEAAAEALVQKTKVGSTELVIATNGHLDADGSGHCGVTVTGRP